VGATSNCLWWALNGVSLQFACSKCGTTVRESPYTDTVLFGEVFECVPGLTLAGSQVKMEPDMRATTPCVKKEEEKRNFV